MSQKIKHLKYLIILKIVKYFWPQNDIFSKDNKSKSCQEKNKTLKSENKLELLSAKMTFFETNLAKIIADPKCARQELSNDVSHVYVSSKIRKD